MSTHQERLDAYRQQIAAAKAQRMSSDAYRQRVAVAAAEQNYADLFAISGEHTTGLVAPFEVAFPILLKELIDLHDRVDVLTREVQALQSQARAAGDIARA